MSQGSLVDRQPPLLLLQEREKAEALVAFSLEVLIEWVLTQLVAILSMEVAIPRAVILLLAGVESHQAEA